MSCLGFRLSSVAKISVEHHALSLESLPHQIGVLSGVVCFQYAIESINIRALLIV